ncbi:MAG: hypothetical protein KDC43_06050 [Saprospiraceae bacterium]|nr:hypothetical protein [Saprospiraceae bacterium]MCB0623478.1 hypothetical protein [Saprospiraceae bacterium]MCB0682294.1 hypothetical protein [Saprospiraceae bacterium]
MEFVYVLGIIFVAFGLSFVLINIRQIFTGKEFRGTCATNNPMLKDQIGECTVCGRKPDEECKMPEVGQGQGKVAHS